PISSLALFSPRHQAVSPVGGWTQTGACGASATGPASGFGRAASGGGSPASGLAEMPPHAATRPRLARDRPRERKRIVAGVIARTRLLPRGAIRIATSVRAAAGCQARRVRLELPP